MDSSVSDKTRLDGLDTLRAIAIIIVLIYHYKVVVSRENLFGFISSVGWTGVDLFFVLSGYLIGNQVLSAIAKGQEFSLRLFYIRRFLRTLPNYYFVLALYFIFPVALSGTATAPLWSFLTFTQNLDMRARDHLRVDQSNHHMGALLNLGLKLCELIRRNLKYHQFPELRTFLHLSLCKHPFVWEVSELNCWLCLQSSLFYCFYDSFAVCTKLGIRNLFVQFNDCIHQLLWTWWATWKIDINWYNVINALHDCIVVKHST